MTAPMLVDPEKGFHVDITSPALTMPPEYGESEVLPLSGFAKWNAKFESVAGLETRGITRVMPDERQKASAAEYIQMAFIWFSSNITANNLAVGLLGPLTYELSFLDCALCAVFGAFVGSLGTAYMSIWGPQSGNRTMVGINVFVVRLPC
jgi:hypothetical protein